MRIITVEEHVSYGRLSAETWGPLSQAAPYLGTASREGLPYYTAGDALAADEQRIARMDEAGIDMQVLSYASSTQLLPPAQAVELAAEANNHLAEVISTHPDRFAGFATLPWSAPEAAAIELERAVRQLGLKGALLSGRPSGDAVFLDAPQFRPVLAAAAALGVPIFVHPGYPVQAAREAYYSGLGELVSDRLSLYGWGWHAEAGVQLLRIILAGVFDELPGLQLIAGHWGEMVPFFLARLDEALPPAATGLRQSISEYFKKHVYVTPSGMFDMPHLKFITEVMGADRIMHSVDYPFIGCKRAAQFLADAPISGAERELIAHSNAERLLGL